jgi:RNA polymerase sigma factor (sigma-70 family)
VSVSADGDLERLYREHGDRLWRSVLAYAGDREVASDAVSEAFAQALRRGDAIRDPLPWLFRTAFRVAAGELADRRRRCGSDPPEEAGYEMLEPADQLVSALRRLSRKQRAAVVLHHYAGYSVNEIARMIDSTGPAVRVHLSRGRKSLRALLSKEEETGDA